MGTRPCDCIGSMMCWYHQQELRHSDTQAEHQRAIEREDRRYNRRYGLTPDRPYDRRGHHLRFSSF